MLTVFDGLATKVVADGLLHRSPSLGSHQGHTMACQRYLARKLETISVMWTRIGEAKRYRRRTTKAPLVANVCVGLSWA